MLMDQSRSTLQSHQKRKVTKQDVFAEPTRDDEDYGNQGQIIPTPLTQQDYAMYSGNTQSDSSSVPSPNQPNVQVVGSFDEQNDVLTPNQAKSLHV